MTTEYSLHSDPKACWVTADQVTGAAVREVVYQKATAKVDSSLFGANLRNSFRRLSQTGGSNRWTNVRSFVSWALQLDKPLVALYKLLLKSFGEGMLNIV
jgi:hypothetical protein